jgi:hypothetical protein
MERPDSITFGASTGNSGLAPAIDTASIVTKLESVKEARGLPSGAVVGDQHGGLTFTDAIAAFLESRSTGGWREIQAASGAIWTIIILSR